MILTLSVEAQESGRVFPVQPIPEAASAAVQKFYRSNPHPMPSPDIFDPQVIRGLRAFLEDAWSSGESTLGYEITKIPMEFGGVQTLRVTTPALIGSEGLILYIHGGSYNVGSPNANIMLAARMAHASGLPVISIDYRLAPENPFPAGLEDTVAVYRALLALDIDPGTLVLMGDSAGGGLALATALKLREEGLPQPAALALISPWTDLEAWGDSHKTLSDYDPSLNWDLSLKASARAYAGLTPPSNPLISPVNADFTDIAPMVVHVGSREVLLSDAARLVRKARRAGVEVEFDVWEGMWHVFHAFPGVPESDEAVDAIAHFISRHLK